MRQNDPEKHFGYLRMTKESFDILLHKVSPYLSRRRYFNKYRAAVSPAERLALTPRYLASGDSQVSLSYAFRLRRSTVSSVVRETCQVLWDVLAKDFVKAPSSAFEWQQISRDFFLKWNFPNCIGAIDGKHVTIQAPSKSGSMYFNYKGTFSLNLMAVCDAHYRGSWRNDTETATGMTAIGMTSSNRYSKSASETRSSFKNYFNGSVGQVSWQYQHCFDTSLLEDIEPSEESLCDLNCQEELPSLSSDHRDSTPSVTSLSSTVTPQRKKAKVDMSAEADKMLVQSLKEINERAGERKIQKDDIDLNFALELSGRLKRLPPRQNSWVKLQIHQLLFSVEFCEGSGEPTHIQ